MALIDKRAWLRDRLEKAGEHLTPVLLSVWERCFRKTEEREREKLPSP